jgi:peptidoglycan/xylan/chitin deacetylase (PgdA/CDA1 family)
METLRRHDAPATFFINGNRVNSDATRAIVQEIVDDPLFTLANHTWSHPNMKNLSLDSAASQIDRTTEVIEEAGGAPLYMRFPFGSSNCNTMDLVHDRGQISVGWHIDSADWCFASGNGFCRENTFPDPGLNGFRDSMEAYIMHQVRKEHLQGGVLLFHDIHSATERDLEGILNKLESEDYRFVPLDDGNFPVLHGAPPPPRKFIGDACEEQSDCNFDGGLCGDNGLCTKACFTSCPDRDGYPTTRCAADEDGSRRCALSCAVSICDEGLCTADVSGPTGTWSVCR